MLKTKFAIGCFVQWYEIEIIEEYFESVKQAIQNVDNDENVIVDICINMSQSLEKVDESKISLTEIKARFYGLISSLRSLGKINDTFYESDKIYTIADYRREFNDKYCDDVDVLIWGESDSLIPKRIFEILDNLHNNVKEQTPKYVTFFSVCKMWDDSWKVLEHPDFTDKPFYDSPEEFNPDEHWWSLRYTMSLEEMNSFNDKVDELDIRILNQHKFNGCGLVISSEVIKSGVNIPRSVFFVHEDTSFMMMTNRVLGNIPQYIIKNVLLVHNRNHPKKRMYVKGERSDGTMNEKRRSNEWYVKANKMSEENCYNATNPNYKSYSWENVFDE